MQLLIHRVRCYPTKGQRSGRFEIKDSATVCGDAISAK